jgi:serine/threonine-protein kinase RsbT
LISDGNIILDDERHAAVRVSVRSQHHVLVARQKAKRFAEGAGLRNLVPLEIATCVSELAANLVVHSTDGGSLRFEAVRREGQIGVRVTSVDTGPGIVSITDAMEDGFSTAGSLGGGLPTVQRLMDDLEIATTVGKGTTIAATKWGPL